MNRNYDIVRVTQAEILVAKIKLIGLVIVGIISAVVLAFTGLPP